MSSDRSCNYAFDFDGVIAQYSGYKGKDHAGPPVAEVVEAIRELKQRGHKIIVYGSTRDNDFLKAYCEKHDIPIDYFSRKPGDGFKLFS
jgi:trehalose-6-phosphatase